MMGDWSPVAKAYDPLKAGSIDGTDVEPHDKAVWRAMCARYRPNRGVTGEPHLTLFVARLNPQTGEDRLRDAFSQFGDVRRVRLVRDAVTGISKRYAFVEFKEERALKRAWRDANKLVLEQSELFVDLEQERSLHGWVPRRLGGGQGGNKESGQLRFGGRDRPFRKPIGLSSGTPGARRDEQDRAPHWRDRGHEREPRRPRDRSRDRDSHRRTRD